jgi:hypothetical protein
MDEFSKCIGEIGEEIVVYLIYFIMFLMIHCLNNLTSFHL